jgi:hypothetical protein
MAYKYRWPSLIYQLELWRTLAGVTAGTLTVPLVESMQERNVIVARTIFFVVH